MVFLYTRSTRTACAFIVISIAPEKKPVRKNPTRPSQSVGAKAIHGTQQQNNNPVPTTIRALPNRTDSQPVIGIATSAPIAVVKSSVPSTLHHIPDARNSMSAAERR